MLEDDKQEQERPVTPDSQDDNQDSLIKPSRSRWWIPIELLFAPHRFAERYPKSTTANVIGRVTNVVLWVAIAFVIGFLAPVLPLAFLGFAGAFATAFLFGMIALLAATIGQAVRAYMNRGPVDPASVALMKAEALSAARQGYGSSDTTDKKHDKKQSKIVSPTVAFHPALPIIHDKPKQSDHLPREAKSENIGTVITFNVLGAAAPSGYRDAESEAQESKEDEINRANIEAKGLAKRVGENQDINLIALQELDFGKTKDLGVFGKDWLQRLVEQLNAAKPGSDWDILQSETGLAMLYDKNKLSMQSHLPDSANRDQTAIFTNKKGAQVSVTNGHYAYEPFPTKLRKHLEQRTAPQGQIQECLVLMDSNSTMLDVDIPSGQLQVNSVDPAKFAGTQGAGNGDGILQRKKEEKSGWGKLAPLSSHQVNLDEGKLFPKEMGSKKAGLTKEQLVEVEQLKILLTFDSDTIPLDEKREVTLEQYQKMLEEVNFRYLIADQKAIQGDYFDVAWSSNLENRGVDNGQFNYIYVGMPLKFSQALEKEFENDPKFQFGKMLMGSGGLMGGVSMHKRDFAEFHQKFSEFLGSSVKKGKELLQTQREALKPVEYNIADLGKKENMAKNRTFLGELKYSAMLPDPFLKMMATIIQMDFYVRVAEHYLNPENPAQGYDEETYIIANTLSDPYTNLKSAIEMSDNILPILNMPLSKEERDTCRAAFAQVLTKMEKVQGAVFEDRRKKIGDAEASLANTTKENLQRGTKMRLIKEGLLANDRKDVGVVGGMLTQVSNRFAAMEGREPREEKERGSLKDQPKAEPNLARSDVVAEGGIERKGDKRPEPTLVRSDAVDVTDQKRSAPTPPTIGDNIKVEFEKDYMPGDPKWKIPSEDRWHVMIKGKKGASRSTIPTTKEGIEQLKAYLKVLRDSKDVEYNDAEFGAALLSKNIINLKEPEKNLFFDEQTKEIIQKVFNAQENIDSEQVSVKPEQKKAPLTMSRSDEVATPQSTLLTSVGITSDPAFGGNAPSSAPQVVLGEPKPESKPEQQGGGPTQSSSSS